jgi:type II secretory pathway pseudopilin PulG
MRRSGTERGFTLVEALVALGVLALGIGALAAAFAGSYRGFARALDETGALQVAQARLAAAGSEVVLADGLLAEGVDAGYRWRLAGRRYTPPGPTPPLAGLEAYTVEVTVAWQPGARGGLREITLTTVKLRGSRP